MYKLNYTRVHNYINLYYKVHNNCSKQELTNERFLFLSLFFKLILALLVGMTAQLHDMCPVYVIAIVCWCSQNNSTLHLSFHWTERRCFSLVKHVFQTCFDPTMWPKSRIVHVKPIVGRTINYTSSNSWFSLFSPSFFPFSSLPLSLPSLYCLSNCLYHYHKRTQCPNIFGS